MVGWAPGQDFGMLEAESGSFWLGQLEDANAGWVGLGMGRVSGGYGRSLG